MPRKEGRKLQICKCKRCGYEWVPRINEGDKPKRCAGCKSKYWDRDIKHVQHSEETRKRQRKKWDSIRSNSSSSQQQQKQPQKKREKTRKTPT